MIDVLTEGNITNHDRLLAIRVDEFGPMHYGLLKITESMRCEISSLRVLCAEVLVRNVDLGGGPDDLALLEDLKAAAGGEPIPLQLPVQRWSTEDSRAKERKLWKQRMRGVL